MARSRINLMPKKLADSENSALTTAMSFTGTAAELDESYQRQPAELIAHAEFAQIHSSHA